MRVLSVVKCAHQVRAQLRARPRHRTLTLQRDDLANVAWRSAPAAATTVATRPFSRVSQRPDLAAINPPEAVTTPRCKDQRLRSIGAKPRLTRLFIVGRAGLEPATYGL